MIIHYSIEGSSHEAESSSGYGNPGNYIKSINLPHQLQIGEEYVSESTPVIILKRELSIIREFFQRPYFSIAKEIRVQFHWEGIKIVGSYMEEPNKFVFPLPTKKGEHNEHNWYLKVICSNDAKPGFKPLYVSIDTFSENMLLKWTLKLFKILSLIALLGIVIIGIFYKNTILGAIVFKDDLFTSDSMIVKGLSPFFVFLVLLIAFWKNVSSTFESFYKHENRALEKNLTYHGIKDFSEKFGITVINTK